MPLRGFDPGNMKWYDNNKEHVTKKANKGLEPTTKKLIQDMMRPNTSKTKPKQ